MDVNSAARISVFSGALSNSSAVKPVGEIRRDNLLLLIEKSGSKAALNARLGRTRTDATISQYANRSPDSKTGKPKMMGGGFARRIEQALGLPDGWMDASQGATLEITAAEPSSEGPEDVNILQFDTGGAMGDGLLLRDQPGVIQSWRVSPDWVQKNVHHITSPGNLAIVTGFGDSMKPLYNPGDPLLVDRGVTAVEFDGIYFFRIGDEGFIKRLQRIPGVGLRAISENKAYESWDIGKGMDFEVFARVVKVWRGEDF